MRKLLKIETATKDRKQLPAILTRTNQPGP